MVKMAQEGWLTDPADVALYVFRGRDRKNLPLWLCCRGTNRNERSVHKKLARNFMSMQTASVELGHFSLLEWVQRHNLWAVHNTQTSTRSVTTSSGSWRTSCGSRTRSTASACLFSLTSVRWSYGFPTPSVAPFPSPERPRRRTCYHMEIFCRRCY